MIAGLLLAAGEGSRFGAGTDKLLALLLGRSVLARSAATLAAEVGRLVVVVPAGAPGRIAEVRAFGPAIVEHRASHAGMAGSLRAGVEALGPDVDAVIVALADQPCVRREVIRALIEVWSATGASAVAPEYRNGQGNPVLFARPAWPALTRLAGDVGGRAALASLGDALVLLPVDGDIPADVDTPDALRALEEQLRRDS